MSEPDREYRYSLRLAPMVLTAFGLLVATVCALVSIGSDGTARAIAAVIGLATIAGVAVGLRAFTARRLAIGAHQIRLVGFAGRQPPIDVSATRFVSEVRVRTAFAGDELLLAFWVPGRRSGIRAKLAVRGLTAAEAQRLVDAERAGHPLTPLFVSIEGLEATGIERLQAIRAQLDLDQV